MLGIKLTAGGKPFEYCKEEKRISLDKYFI